MYKKIIFLDIDGTLTEPGSNEPPASAVTAVKKAREKGNYVFLCTGRNYDMLSPLLKYGFDGIIASSGGYIRCGEKVIYDCPLPETQRVQVMEVLKKGKIYRTVECMDGSYTDEAFKEFLRDNAKKGSNSEMLRWRKQIEESLNIRPMEQYRGQPIYKVVVMCQKKEQLEEAQRLLGGDLDFCIQDTDRFGYLNGEIISKQFDKGKGISRVCEYLHIPIENTVAFGDSMNDVGMMQKAALSICMEDGSEKLKRMADDVCPPVTKDGIYQAFMKYHLM